MFIIKGYDETGEERLTMTSFTPQDDAEYIFNQSYNEHIVAIYNHDTGELLIGEDIFTSSSETDYSKFKLGDLLID